MTLKEKYLYEKAIHTKNFNDFKNALEQLDDENKLFILINEFLKTNFTLSMLFTFNINNIDEILLKFFSDRCPKNSDINISLEDIKVLLEKKYNDVILAIEKYYVLKKKTLQCYGIVELSKVYDSDILKFLHNNTKELFILYMKTKDRKILDIIVESGATISDICNFRNIVNEKQHIKFIESFVKNNQNINVSCLQNSVLNEEELKKICKIILENNMLTSNLCYFFLKGNYFYFESERKKIISVIISSGNERDIYYTLMNITLNDEEIQQLEEALAKTKNLEYNFYYSFWKDKDNFVELFGGYVALVNYIKDYCINFSNRSELRRVRQISEECSYSKKEIEDKLNNFLFKDDSEVCQAAEKNKKTV